MLRDEIAYEIYKTGRASKATMSFEEFVASDCCYKDTPTWRDAADGIVKLIEKDPEMVGLREAGRETLLKIIMGKGTITQVLEWKEKAEKWDAQQGTLDELLTDVRKDITTLMDGLMVREKCEKCNGLGKTFGCVGCGGTGTIEREATVEELAEMIDYGFNPDCIRWYTRDGKWTFDLKSGTTLFMKEKE